MAFPRSSLSYWSSLSNTRLRREFIDNQYKRVCACARASDIRVCDGSDVSNLTDLHGLVRSHMGPGGDMADHGVLHLRTSMDLTKVTVPEAFDGLITHSPNPAIPFSWCTTREETSFNMQEMRDVSDSLLQELREEYMTLGRGDLRMDDDCLLEALSHAFEGWSHSSAYIKIPQGSFSGEKSVAVTYHDDGDIEVDEVSILFYLYFCYLLLSFLSFVAAMPSSM